MKAVYGQVSLHTPIHAKVNVLNNNNNNHDSERIIYGLKYSPRLVCDNPLVNPSSIDCLFD